MDSEKKAKEAFNAFLETEDGKLITSIFALLRKVIISAEEDYIDDIDFDFRMYFAKHFIQDLIRYEEIYKVYMGENK